MRNHLSTWLRAVSLVVMISLPFGVAIGDERININTADAATLQLIHGIGESRAKAIIAYRDEHGPFKTVDELVNIPGIGIKTLESMREQVKVED